MNDVGLQIWFLILSKKRWKKRETKFLVSNNIPMSNFDKLPKLIYKKNYEEFSKRDKEDQLTKEDIDDWFEAFTWIVETMTSKEFQEFKVKGKTK